jgi:hypothetical protein
MKNEAGIHQAQPKRKGKRGNRKSGTGVFEVHFGPCREAELHT